MCVFSEMCFFFGDFNVATLQPRSSTHTHTHTHTNTHTHDRPTVAYRSSGSRGVFRVFANNFLTTCGRQVFLTARGSRNIRKYFQSVTNVFCCLCLYMYAGTMLQKFKVMLGKLLKCKAQLLEINRAPTAG